MWVRDETLPDEWQPNRAHVYVNDDLRKNTPDVVQVHVDPDYPDAWREGAGKQIVEKFKEEGTHVVVVTGKQINFEVATDRRQPAKLILEWLL